MPKIPRDLDAKSLIKALAAFNYAQVRQTGNHIRLLSNYMGEPHSITIPNHEPIKIGTLNSILKDISSYLKISKDELCECLFSR